MTCIPRLNLAEHQRVLRKKNMNSPAVLCDQKDVADLQVLKLLFDLAHRHAPLQGGSDIKIPSETNHEIYHRHP